MSLCVVTNTPVVVAILGIIIYFQGRMGIVPGFGAVTHLHRKIGYKSTLDLLLACKPVSALYAKSINLVDEILEDNTDQSDELALELAIQFVASKVGSLPVNVVRGIKGVCNGADSLSYRESIENENKQFKSLWGGEDNLKALQSNLKHRT